MALVRNWRIIKFGGVYGDVKKECKNLDLRGCKKILIKFDPFRQDSRETRDFNHLIVSYEATKKNPNISVRTEILTDRSEPTITVDLVNGEKLFIKSANIKVVELFKLLNAHVTPLAPVDEPEEKATKAIKSLLKKKK